MRRRRVVIKASLKWAANAQKNRKVLEHDGFEVLILWDEMWPEMSEYMYEKWMRYDPDEVIMVGGDLTELWRGYELE